jgi:hypothetical protein
MRQQKMTQDQTYRRHMIPGERLKFFRRRLNIHVVVPYVAVWYVGLAMHHSYKLRHAKCDAFQYRSN